MAHIILTGATGLAGSSVLQTLLEHPSVSRISILSRRPMTLPRPSGNSDASKASVILHTDYTAYPQSVLSQLAGASACIWAQGISSTGMGEQEYEAITVTYPVAAARAFATLAAAGAGSTAAKPFTFVYVSGEGADQTEQSWAMFGRVKGRAEKALLALQNSASPDPSGADTALDTAPAPASSLSVYCARPGGIDPRATWLADRQKQTKERVYGLLFPVFRVLYPSMLISTNDLAEALVKLALDGGKAVDVAGGVGVECEGRVLRNTALRKMAGV